MSGVRLAGERGTHVNSIQHSVRSNLTGVDNIRKSAVLLSL